uniref:Uncharacterized protein n=1 Tax=Salix viminalis TaxID=40686 RepID=A0A6N2N7Y3_SALVM
MQVSHSFCFGSSRFVLFHPFLIGLKVSTVDILPLTRTVRANLQNSGLIVVRNPKWQPSLASCRLSF